MCPHHKLVESIYRDFIGVGVVAFTFVIFAVAPTEPNPIYSTIMVLSGVLSGLIVIQWLHRMTTDKTTVRSDSDE